LGGVCSEFRLIGSVEGEFSGLAPLFGPPIDELPPPPPVVVPSDPPPGKANGEFEFGPEGVLPAEPAGLLVGVAPPEFPPAEKPDEPFMLWPALACLFRSDKTVEPPCVDECVVTDSDSSEDSFLSATVLTGVTVTVDSAVVLITAGIVIGTGDTTALVSFGSDGMLDLTESADILSNVAKPSAMIIPKHLYNREMFIYVLSYSY
jgi:hypothetical protein